MPTPTVLAPRAPRQLRPASRRALLLGVAPLLGWMLASVAQAAPPAPSAAGAKASASASASVSAKPSIAVSANAAPASSAAAPSATSTTTTAIDATPASEGPSAEMLLHSEPGGLTAEVAAKLAAATSRSAKVDEAKLAAAGAQVDSAWDMYLPRLSFLARYTRLSPITAQSLGSLPFVKIGGDGYDPTTGKITDPTKVLVQQGAIPLAFPVYLNSYTLQATLLIPLSDYVFRIYDQNKAAASNQKAIRMGAEVNRQQVSADARVGFYNWLRAKGSVVIAKAAVKQADLHLKDLKEQFKVNAVTKADVGRIEASVAAAQLAQTRTENLVIITEANLRTMMHTSDDDALIIGEDLTAEVAPLTADLRALKASAFSKRPELLAIDAQLEALQASNNIVAANMYPRLDAIGNTTYSRPNQRYSFVDEFKFTWDASIQLTWSPNDYLIGKNQKRESDANIATLKATRTQLEDALGMDVVSNYTRVKEAEAAVVSSAAERRATEEAYRVRWEQWKLNATTSSLLYDAEADVTRARLNELSARADLRIARVGLKKAIGDL
jgi:outer membrane protein TolC